jgi:hypothetical protein
MTLLGLGLVVFIPLAGAGWLFSGPFKDGLPPKSGLPSQSELQNAARSFADAVFEGKSGDAFRLLAKEEKAISGVNPEAFDRFYASYIRPALRSIKIKNITVRDISQSPRYSAEEHFSVTARGQEVLFIVTAIRAESGVGVEGLMDLVYLAFKLDPTIAPQAPALGGDTLAFRNWIKREAPRLKEMGIKGYPVPIVDKRSNTVSGIKLSTWPEELASLEKRAQTISSHYLKKTVPIP